MTRSLCWSAFSRPGTKSLTTFMSVTHPAKHSKIRHALPWTLACGVSGQASTSSVCKQGGRQPIDFLFAASGAGASWVNNY